jgi:hypothetical protein
LQAFVTDSSERLLLRASVLFPGVVMDAQRADGAMWSHRVGWEDFLVPVSVDVGRPGLGLDGDWPGRWNAGLGRIGGRG